MNDASLTVAYWLLCELRWRVTSSLLSTAEHTRAFPRGAPGLVTAGEWWAAADRLPTGAPAGAGLDGPSCCGAFHTKDEGLCKCISGSEVNVTSTVHFLKMFEEEIISEKTKKCQPLRCPSRARDAGASESSAGPLRRPGPGARENLTQMQAACLDQRL